MDGTGVLFEPLIEALPPSLTATVVTYPTDTPLGYGELLPLVIAALPTDRSFVLLGESFSGPLALLAAQARPPGLCGVVLCASFVRNPVRFLPGWSRHLLGAGLFRLFPAFAQAKALLGGYSTPRLRELAGRAHGMVSPAVFAARARAILSVDVTEALRVCPVPILYLAGASDHVVPRHNARLIQRANPAVRGSFVPGPHLVLQTSPVEACRAIGAFTATLGAF